MKISRRSFILGGSAAIAAAGFAPALSGCSNKTKSGIDPKNFECEGTKTLGTGMEPAATSGVPTKLYVITNKNGAELCITNFGARIVSLMVPDKQGQLKNMVLGFDNIKDYASFNTLPNNFYGSCVGRFGNRIAKGKFSINGQNYQVDTNEKTNMLHGGKFGFHFQTFKEVKFDKNKSITLELVSPDGDMGFPGEMTLQITYSLNDNNTLGIYYEAKTTKDTVCNISNHSYWDPSGDPNAPITEDNLFICSKATTPVDNELIPSGEIALTPAGSVFDFFGEKGEGKQMGKDKDVPNQQLTYGKGYDHNFVLLGQDVEKMSGIENDGKFQITDDGSEKLQGKANMVAKATSKTSGITMTIKSTEPSVQFFDCHDMDGSITGLGGKKWTKYAAFVLEPQHYPDSPNHENFPTTILKAGDVYQSKSEYSFTC